jgi:hypothetical protein
LTQDPEIDPRIETAASLDVSELAQMPKFRWRADPTKLYSLFMLNPDVPSRREAFEVTAFKACLHEQQNLVAPCLAMPCNTLIGSVLIWSSGIAQHGTR